MGTATINWWAVITAAVAYMALGALWYSPALFAAAWMKGIGKTKEQLAAGFTPLVFVWALFFSFMAAYGIGRIFVLIGLSSVWDGIVLGLLAGTCFVLPTMGVNDIFEQRPCRLCFINVLYHIAGFVLIGVIIGAWR
jgi:hypothetical protein